MKTSSLEFIVINRLNALKFPPCEREYKFHNTRRWRFDFYWGKPHFIAIEADGAIFQNGGHCRGKQIISDAEKYNEAQLMGIKVFRITTGNLDDLKKIKEKYFS